MWYQTQICSVLTWDLSGGDGVSVQLVGVQQPRQSFGSTALVFITGEVLPLNSEVREKSWNGREEGGIQRGRSVNTQKTKYPTLSLCTIRGVCEDKVLQLCPLCGKSSNELEGVHWVPQKTLRVTGGCRRENLQFVCPSGRRHRVLSPSTFTQQLL